MNQSATLARVRVRRLHLPPPSSWTVWFVLYGLLILVDIFRDVGLLLQGLVFEVVPTVILAAVLFVVYAMQRHQRRIEEQLGLPLQPPHWIAWAALGYAWAINIYVWIVI